jgi:hypothetical protein
MLSASPEDDRHLPGDASKQLVRSVRRNLKRFGICPMNPLWRLTWEWVAKISDSYVWSTKRFWPQSGEIACQYVLLLLAQIKSDEGRCFKLPFRAGKCVPAAVAAVLPKNSADKMIAYEEALFAALDAQEQSVEKVAAPLPVIDVS